VTVGGAEGGGGVVELTDNLRNIKTAESISLQASLCEMASRFFLGD